MKGTLYKLPLLFVALCTFITLPSCEDTIDPVILADLNGQVIDAVTRAPIAGATVTTNPPTTSVITNADGTFFLTNIPTGQYALSVKADGYSAANQQVTVREEQSNPVVITLSRSNATNRAPAAPSVPTPEDGATDRPTTLDLTWLGSVDLDNDTVRYDVVLYEADSINPIQFTNITDTTVTVANLRHDATYYWQVTAKDELHSVRGPVWTFRTLPYPNNRILFSRNLNGNYEIFSGSTDATNILRITNNNGLDWRPQLSPQRDLIAFTANEGPDTYLYTMTRDGRQRQRISPLPVTGYHNNGLGFAWSPDGGRLLFTNYQNLYTVRRDGSDLTLIAQAPAGRHWRDVDWTAQNGGKIAALAIGANPYDSEIYLMNPNGSNQQMIVANMPGAMGGPVFSIDGTKFLYTRDVSGFESAIADGRQLNSHIFLYDLTTGESTDLSEDKEEGTNDLFPRFSPDGAQVIFVNTSNDGIGAPDVYTMMVDGSSRDLYQANATTPDWR